MPETFLSHAAVCAAERGDADEILRLMGRIDGLEGRIRPASFHLVVAMNHLRAGNGVVGGVVSRWTAARADDTYTPRLALMAFGEARLDGRVDIAALWARMLTGRLRPLIEASAEQPQGGTSMLETVLDQCAVVFSQAGDRELAAACMSDLAAARTLPDTRDGRPGTVPAGPIQQERR